MRARKGRSETFETLRSVGLFSTCDNDELASIDRFMTEISVGPDHELMREGEQGREFVILLEGSARVTKGGEEVAVVGPGTFLGELALLDGEPRAATVTTTSEVRALILNAGEFGSLLDESPALRAKILRAAEERR